MKEKWDIYDKYMKKTGKTCIRGEYKLKEDEYHLVVHIWIISKQGKILLTQRAETKQTDPLKWECTGGSVLKDEDIINKIKFTDGEVKDQKWVSKKEFEEMYNKGEALSNLKYILEENIDTKYKK